jgi:RNAse (barnase) inhibitor barstar
MVYEIDGARFDTLEEFFDEISTVLISGSEWGRNLDAFSRHRCRRCESGRRR